MVTYYDISCRLPSSLLAAGMPLEFRLTLDFMPSICTRPYKFQVDIFTFTFTIRPEVDDGLPLVSPT